MPQKFLLIRRLPDGPITAHATPFDTISRAARAAGLCLFDNGAEVRTTAQKFGAELAAQPLGSIMEHRSGYVFRILAADFTEDGAPITPGARLFNYYDAVWGTVLPDQFMAEGILYPGGSAFDGWYDFARESDGWTYKLNGQRLAARKP